MDEWAINDTIQLKREEIEHLSTKLIISLKNGETTNDDKEKKYKDKNKKTPKEIFNIIDFIYELIFTDNEII